MTVYVDELPAAGWGNGNERMEFADGHVTIAPWRAALRSLTTKETACPAR